MSKSPEEFKQEMYQGIGYFFVLMGIGLGYGIGSYLSNIGKEPYNEFELKRCALEEFNMNYRQKLFTNIGYQEYLRGIKIIIDDDQTTQSLPISLEKTVMKK